MTKKNETRAQKLGRLINILEAFVSEISLLEEADNAAEILVSRVWPFVEITQGDEDLDEEPTLFDGRPFWAFMLGRFPDFLPVKDWVKIERLLEANDPRSVSLASSLLSKAAKLARVAWALLACSEGRSVGVRIPIEKGDALVFETKDLSANFGPDAWEFSLRCRLDGSNFQYINPRNLQVI